MKFTCLCAAILICGMVGTALATGGCGDTQNARDPPETDSKTCTAETTVITKTLHWNIYWLDSNIPRSVNIIDVGETSGNGHGCIECWPEFDSPYWVDNGKTAYWYQKTFKAIFGAALPGSALSMTLQQTTTGKGTDVVGLLGERNATLQRCIG